MTSGAPKAREPPSGGPRARGDGPSPAGWVQLLQALVARELVESFGLPERRAAELLGLVPSSVSQYLSGKRLGPQLSRYLGEEASRRIARATAQRLLSGSEGTEPLLSAAIDLSRLHPAAGAAADAGTAASVPVPARGAVPRWLRARIAGEQNAVAECMRLAQRSRDELTRALFRQIASDSLRHAEIVASIAAYLDRGLSTSVPTGITAADIERLIAREQAAEASDRADLAPSLGGVMRILWESMEADERKHELLLQRLLAAAQPIAPGAAPSRSARARRRPEG